MRAYLAGPMTGLPDFNIPAFNERAAALRSAGHDIVNPAELDGDDLSQPWEFYLRRDIPYLLTCEAVVVLPGWRQSKGASLETHVARELGMPILDAHTLTPVVDDSKPTNPKDAIGCGKLPLELVPDSAIALESLALLEGAAKYGRYNWRAAGVRASIYRAAALRHFAAWWNGEDADPVTGVPHLASVRACLAIIIDAGICGKLTDDRPPRAPIGEMVRRLEPEVGRIKALFADKSPHQYTIADSEAV